MPYGKLAEDILNDWRAAERELATVDAYKDERLRLEKEIERLRDEYHELADEANRKHRVVDVPPYPPALSDTDHATTDTDQTAADADQAASDRDQAASDSDDIHAAMDQRQSDRDQARSDRQHAEQQPVTASEETEYLQSRGPAPGGDHRSRCPHAGAQRHVARPRCLCRETRSGSRRSGPAKGRMRQDHITVRPLNGREDLDLFRSIPYGLNNELEGDLDAGRRRLEWLWVAQRAKHLVGRVGWWTRSADDPPLVLDILDVSDVDDGVRLVETAMRAVLPAGFDAAGLHPLPAARLGIGRGARPRRRRSGGPCWSASALGHWSNACAFSGTQAVRCRSPTGGCGSGPWPTARSWSA